MKTIDDAKKALKINIIMDIFKNSKQFDEQYGKLEGQRVDKRFYNVDSNLLRPLIYELLTNTDCGYRLYMDERIKEGYIPKSISCLLKQLSEHENEFGEIYKDREVTIHEVIGEIGEVGALREVLSSQILNYFGCPTVYNAIVETLNKDNNVEFKVISADFMEGDKVFSTFDDYRCEISQGLEFAIKNINNKILNKIKTISNEEKQKFIRDFIKTYFVRGYVLNDGDFYHCNIGQIVDPYQHKISLINFDYECSFCQWHQNSMLVNQKIKRFQKDIDYLRTHFPSEYKELMEDLKTLNIAFNEMLKSGEIDFMRDVKPEYDYPVDFSSGTSHIYCELNNILYRINTAIKEMELVKWGLINIL